MQIRSYTRRVWRSHPPYSSMPRFVVKRAPLKKLVPKSKLYRRSPARCSTISNWRPGKTTSRAMPRQGRWRAHHRRRPGIGRDDKPVPIPVSRFAGQAAGRYNHPIDQHNSPLDPNISSVRFAVLPMTRRVCATDASNRALILVECIRMLAAGAIFTSRCSASLPRDQGGRVFFPRLSLDPARSVLIQFRPGLAV